MRILLIAFVLLPGFAAAQSLDLGAADHGLSIGNSPRWTGLRLNAVDSQVECIRGLNLTLWTPGDNPEAVYQGIHLALIGTKGRRIDGIALSGIGVNAGERFRGIGAGILGLGAQNMDGIASGLVLVDVKQRLRGIVLAGGWIHGGHDMAGLAITPGLLYGKKLRGIALCGIGGGGDVMQGVFLGGLGVGGGQVDGIVIGGAGLGGKTLRGVFTAGLGIGCESLDGIALTAGGMGGKSLDGVMIAGLGMGAEEIRGLAAGSLLVYAKRSSGITVGALNGLYIDRIDLDDFLHFNFACERSRGLQIGLVNYTRDLKGLQIGLFNYAGNNPAWARLLPGINIHL